MQTLKTSKSYRIQLTGGQLLWVGALSVMSLGVSFYLGLATGNSLRLPANNTVLQVSGGGFPLQTDNIKTSGQSVATLTPEQLGFFNKLDEEGRSQKNKTVISAEKLAEITKTTSRLQQEVSKNEDALNTEGNDAVLRLKKIEKTPKSPEKKINNNINTSVSSNTTRRPATLVQAKQVGVFTLQVFTSSNKKKAEELVKRLIESGYLEAYLQSFENSEKKVLYRVRVAKTDRSSVESIADKIKKLSYIEHVQIRRL